MHEPRHHKATRAQLERSGVDQEAQLVQDPQLDLLAGLERVVQRHERCIHVAQHGAVDKATHDLGTRLTRLRQRLQRVHSFLRHTQQARTLALQTRPHGHGEAEHVRGGVRHRHTKHRAYAAQGQQHVRSLPLDRVTYLALTRELRIDRRLVLLGQRLGRRGRLFRSDRGTHLGIPLIHTRRASLVQRLLALVRRQHIDVRLVTRRAPNSHVLCGPCLEGLDRQVAHDIAAHARQHNVRRNKGHSRQGRLCRRAPRWIRVRIVDEAQHVVDVLRDDLGRIERVKFSVHDAAQRHEKGVTQTQQLRSVREHNHIGHTIFRPDGHEQLLHQFGRHIVLRAQHLLRQVQGQIGVMRAYAFEDIPHLLLRRADELRRVNFLAHVRTVMHIAAKQGQHMRMHFPVVQLLDRLARHCKAQGIRMPMHEVMLPHLVRHLFVQQERWFAARRQERIQRGERCSLSMQWVAWSQGTPNKSHSDASFQRRFK